MTGYAQTIATITGETRVCPNVTYTYKFSLDKAVTERTTISLFISDGVFTNTGASTMNYSLEKDKKSFDFMVRWNDVPTNMGRINSLSFNYPELRNVTITSMSGVGASVSGSISIASDGTISIPYGQQGTLTLTASANYPYLSGNEYTISTFEWKYNGSTTKGTKTFSLNYGLGDLDGVTVVVTPIGKVCSEKYGRASTIKIKRIFPSNVSVTTGTTLACKDNTVNFSISNSPAGASIIWRAGSYFSLISSNGTSASFKASPPTPAIAGGAAGKVMVDFSYNGIIVKTLENTAVWTGRPSISIAIPANPLKPNTTYQASATLTNATTTYQWSLDGEALMANLIGSTTDRVVSFKTKTPFKYTSGSEESPQNDVRLKLISTNACGTSQFISITPVRSSALRSSFAENDLTAMDNIKVIGDIAAVKIYSLTGSVVYHSENVSHNFDIKTTNLNDGVYIVEKTDTNGTVSRDKMILKR